MIFCAACAIERSTTPDTEFVAVRVRVTHPFHPLFDQDFAQTAERASRHGDRVWVERCDGSVSSLPRAWTDQAEPEPFVELSAGRAHFRPEDLVELAGLVAGIRSAADGPQGGEDV